MRAGMPAARASAAKRYAWPWHSARRSRSTSIAVKESIVSLAMLSFIQARMRPILSASAPPPATLAARSRISPRLLGAAMVAFRYFAGSPCASGALRSTTHFDRRHVCPPSLGSAKPAGTPSRTISMRDAARRGFVLEAGDEHAVQRDLEHRPPVGGDPGGGLHAEHARQHPEGRPLEKPARLPADDALLGLGELLRLALEHGDARGAADRQAAQHRQVAQRARGIERRVERQGPFLAAAARLDGQRELPAVGPPGHLQRA